MASTSITDIMHLAPPFLEDPYPFFERARREAPVFFSPIFHVWIVSRHQEVTTVLRDPTRFSSTEVLSPPNLPPEVVEGYRNAPETMVAEVIDGELSLLPRPRLGHVNAATELGSALRSGFGRRGQQYA